MKKMIFVVVLIFIIIVMFFVVKNNLNSEDKSSRNDNNSYDYEENDNDILEKGEDSMNVIINGKSYEVLLYDNDTVHSLLEMLPLELNMTELNGNEKYYYLESSLPTNSKNPDRIEKGDIMLYGNDCLVIFYKSFNTGYSYTRIGHIDNLPDLGKGNIKVVLEKDR